MEDEFDRLDQKYDKLMDNVSGSEVPGAENQSKIEKLQLRVH